MKSSRKFGLVALLAVILGSMVAVVCGADPLPSWNEGASKTAIINFVARVTTDGSPDFVKPEDRIATFDNDGTLWCEQPIYFQFIFALDRIRALAPTHPAWNDLEPFKSVLNNDINSVMASGEKGVATLVAASHAGMTTDDFTKIVRAWLKTARHPKYHRPYTQCVYQPMLELLNYLRARGFKTYIVSGGGVEFMRAFAEQTYGIPPEQVIGSRGKLQYQERNGKPVLVKLPGIDFIDDGPGKPIAIQEFIGKRPVMAFGNSDGDFQMLKWTTSAPGPRFGLLVHHTDADREYAYDRDSRIGKLDKALDEASANGWTVVDMKNDWNVIFPAEKQ